MTDFYLVRHGANDALHVALAGRTAGVSLNAEGLRQAAALAEIFAGLPVDAVHTSPLERTWQTAEPIARRLGVPLEVVPRLNEIDFGGWDGADFESLAPRDEWRAWNTVRTAHRPPGGERIIAVQARMVEHIQQVFEDDPTGCYVVVGHGDPLKSTLFYYLGVPLDFVDRVQLSPASVSAVRLNASGPQILFVNRTPAGPEEGTS